MFSMNVIKLMKTNKYIAYLYRQKQKKLVLMKNVEKFSQKSYFSPFSFLENIKKIEKNNFKECFFFQLKIVRLEF